MPASHRIRRISAALLSALTLAISPALAQQPSAADFRHDVRPILSEACFQCHGPDPATRMAGLRLDTQEGAFAKRDSGAPVVPGKPEDSLIYQRITTDDAVKRMPPSYSNKTLTAEQKDVLKRWIAGGAKWQQLWSFTAPVRPEFPPVKNERWAKAPIDRFLLAKLETAGLEPANEADRRTLIRRVTLDLTGLPPSPKEVEAFVNDKSADAYEKLVDRLLASEHYGEHRARYWLDAARYADTNGLHYDNYREMWPYRDWVISAFNRNQPFDQFTIEQLAGDLLPNPTVEQRVATGFHRNNITTAEGGSIEDEVLAIYAKDRVDTTGTVFLGLTVGCATCHDHKFDPITQKDFYSLAAFFRNTTQPALDDNRHDSVPNVVLPMDRDRTRWIELRAKADALKSRMDEERKTAAKDFERWLESGARQEIEAPLDVKSELVSLSVDSRARIANHGKAADLPLPAGVAAGDSWIGQQALRFDDSAMKLPNVEAITGDEPFTIAMWVYLPKPRNGADDDPGFSNYAALLSQLTRTKVEPEKKEEGAAESRKRTILRGFIVELSGRRPGLKLIGDEGKSIEVEAQVRAPGAALEEGAWSHIAFTYDGSRDQTGLRVFVNGNAVGVDYAGGEPAALLEPGSGRLRGSIRTDATLELGGNGDKYVFRGGSISDLRIFSRDIHEQEARTLAMWPQAAGARQTKFEELSKIEKDALLQYFLTTKERDYRKLAEERDKIDNEIREIEKRAPTTLVMEEKSDSKAAAHILYRGMYDQPREEVEAAVLSSLPAMDPSLPRNRLGLAKWLVDPANPLLARVTVNRFWQEVFGTGIVRTAEDFGSQGESPSHPELLDWLAVEFEQSGWDVKRLFRLMVTSSAYRQSAATTALKSEKDPDNRLLSRGPRFRMDAEMIRDYALAASGLLSPEIGGPSVRPYQPGGLWETVAMKGSNTGHYRRDSGEKLYRRSMYTFWKRASPPASMDILNAPSREVCTVRRERTNTPIQALVSMNDPQFVEAARHLAEDAMVAVKDENHRTERQLDFMAMRLLARDLESNERELAMKAYRDYLRHYDSNPDDAKKLIAVGESKPNPKLPAPEFAALTVMANSLLNLDETLNK